MYPSLDQRSKSVDFDNPVDGAEVHQGSFSAGESPRLTLVFALATPKAVGVERNSAFEFIVKRETSQNEMNGGNIDFRSVPQPRSMSENFPRRER